MTLNLKGAASNLNLKDLSVSHSYFDYLRTQTINVKVSEQVNTSFVPATRDLGLSRTSLSKDGNTLLLSAPQAPYDQLLGVNAGTLYDTAFMAIFTKSGNTWVQQYIDYFKPYSDYSTEFHYFGNVSCLSGDGLTAVVTDFRDVQTHNPFTPSTSPDGRIYIYTRKQSTWVSEMVVPSDLLSDFAGKRFGYSASLSYDGKTLAVGAIGDGSGNGYFSGAVYIFVKQNGAWVQQQKIQAPATLGQNTRFGWSVSLCDDGNIVAIGSPYDQTNGPYVGTVRTYTRSGGVWTLENTFNPKTATSDQPYFGYAVRLSHDGTVLMIGAPFSTDTSVLSTQLYNGLACVYRKVSGVWQAPQYLSNVDFGEPLRDRGQFGWGMSISYDNAWIIVGGTGCGGQQYGGPTGTTLINVQGAIYFYKLTGSTYVPTGSITGLGGAAGYTTDFDIDNNVLQAAGRVAFLASYNGLATGLPWTNLNDPIANVLFDLTEFAFGYDLSSSSTGSTVAVGCPYPAARQKVQTSVDPFLGPTEMKPFPVAGSVYIYEKSGDIWTLQQKIQPGDSALNDMFGMSVSLSANGNTLFVGSPQANTSTPTTGAVYVFTRSGNTWTQVQKIAPTNGVSNGMFGFRTRVSADGIKLFTSAMRYASSSTRVGTVYAYEKATTWDFLQQIVPSTLVADSLFGGYISVSSDGSTLVSGLYNESTVPSLSDFDILMGSGIGAGQVQVFKKTGSLWSLYSTISNTATNNFGRRLDVNSNGTAIAVAAERNPGTYPDQGTVYVYSQSGATYNLSATIDSDLFNITSTSGLYFGSSVSMNDTGDLLVIGADQRGNTILPTYFTPSTGDLFGVVYVFQKINGSWVKQAMEKFRYGMFRDRNGWSCSLARNNNVIVVGALAIQQNQIYILR